MRLNATRDKEQPYKMRAYSLDLRQKVVTAYQHGDGTIYEIASQFSIGSTFAKEMLRLYRQGGGLSFALTANEP